MFIKKFLLKCWNLCQECSSSKTEAKQEDKKDGDDMRNIFARKLDFSTFRFVYSNKLIIWRGCISFCNYFKHVKLNQKCREEGDDIWNFFSAMQYSYTPYTNIPAILNSLNIHFLLCQMNRRFKKFELVFWIFDPHKEVKVKQKGRILVAIMKTNSISSDY